MFCVKRFFLGWCQKIVKRGDALGGITNNNNNNNINTAKKKTMVNHCKIVSKVIGLLVVFKRIQYNFYFICFLTVWF